MKPRFVLFLPHFVAAFSTDVVFCLVGISGLTELLAQSPREAVYVPETDYWSQAEIAGADAPAAGYSACWKRVATPIQGQMLDVDFTDAMHGWAGTTDNSCARTTDGGITWDVSVFNDTNFVTSYEGVEFVDNETGWAVGGAIQIRKTTDGGVTWFKQHGPPVEGINREVFFLDPETGYVVGSKSFPYLPFGMKTTNGGDSWTELDVAFPNAQELIDQYWFNADTGWVCGYNVLLYTTDGGASFSDMFANIPPTGNGYNVLLGIQFTHDQTGWIGAANLERHNIYKTTDGGGSWVFQDNPVSQQGMNQINDVHFLSADTGWAAHGTPGTGAIMITTNGGEEWVIENDRLSWYDCFARISDIRLWCGGSVGSMWYRRIDRTPILTEVAESGEVPDRMMLHQNYPNPFNPTTRITYDLRRGGSVSIRVFDMLGNEVATLVDEDRPAGSHVVEWNGRDSRGGLASSGIYFCKIEAGGVVSILRMMLIR